MVRIERVSRPVVGSELAERIGRIVCAKLPAFNPNRWLSARFVTPTELQALPDLSEEDVEGFRARLGDYRAQHRTLGGVSLRGVYPRRPGLLVADFDMSRVLTEERSRLLSQLGEAAWTAISPSRNVWIGLILGQTTEPMRGDANQVARDITRSMHDDPKAITLGGLQVAVRDGQRVYEL